MWEYLSEMAEVDGRYVCGITETNLVAHLLILELHFGKQLSMIGDIGTASIND